MADGNPDGVRRRRLQRLRAQAAVAGPALALLIGGFILAYQFVEPAPPKRILMATGSEVGAYYAFGKVYAEKFRAQGIELVPRPTAGSIENLGLLESAEIPVAFVQGGIGTPDDHPRLTSLGSIYYEPLWVFVRGEAKPRRLTELKGRRLAVGRQGSGTLPLAVALLAENGITAGTAEFIEIGDAESARALLSDAVDAAFFVGSVTSPLIRDLLGAPNIALMNFEQADAYARRHSFLSKVTLPQGTVDLAANLPAEDTVLLAPAAMVVMSPDLHPAIADLLLLTMSDVHRKGGYFEAPGAFPTAGYVTYPLAPAAERFYERGPPLLQRYLPFWAANLVDRLKILLLPLLTVLYPVFKMFPPLYTWRMRSKVSHWYKDLQAIDDRLRAGAISPQEALDQLDSLDHSVENVSVPVGFADNAYTLRLHIEFLRRKVGSSESTGRSENVLGGAMPDPKAPAS